MKKVIARLDSLHQRVLDTITPIDAQQFMRRPSQTEWSIAEVMHHLRLVEESVIKELERALSRPPERLSLLRRNVPMWIAGVRTFRVKAPKFVEPLNPPPKDETIANYNRVRVALKEFGAKHGRARLEQVAMKHPFLGKINGVSAISFVGYHELRHYKQIREAIKKLTK